MASDPPTQQDYEAAREYLERAVPDEHRVQDAAVWEDAVARCAVATAKLRAAAARRGHPGC